MNLEANNLFYFGIFLTPPIRIVLSCSILLVLCTLFLYQMNKRKLRSSIGLLSIHDFYDDWTTNCFCGFVIILLFTIWNELGVFYSWHV
jgi:hypothetical protein